jgi:trans-o-hydroxybenzylidenepyruvate hydratase-aldolase
MLKAADLRGLYAIIPTPARPGAEKLDATDTVDLDETERLINALIRDGSSGLIVLGTTGECPTLSNADYESFVDCVCSTVKKRVPTYVGATALGGHEVHRRLRFAQERGADGSLLGLPMWQPVTTDMAVKYYAAVSEAFPKLPIMVYANTRAFRYAFPPEFWTALAKLAPTVTSAKVSRPTGLKEMIAGTQGRINFLPIDMLVADFYALSPETTTACWATAAGMGPEPSVAVIDAALRRDEARMKQLREQLAWANQPLNDLFGNPEVFASYNIQAEKARMEAAGYCRPGPVRPPYDELPAEHAAACRECGRRWAELRAKLKETARA